ncbi:hypothetical protein DFJ74DRAFT_702293 [Hyaloraphidium curvatum]|nr:hypothetical protein DFJ74DRAFT_702293 [Hyaloraphidium curvatum]
MSPGNRSDNVEDEEDIVVFAGDDSERLLDRRKASHGADPGRPLDFVGLVKEGMMEAWTVMTTVDWRLISQATPSLALATSGLIFAGWLLDVVQHWPVFNRVSELFILVPIVLNLKGNLEMNLASRLATAANSGLLTEWASIKSVVAGNMQLLQVQAIVVGTLAGVEALVLGAIFHAEFNTSAEDFLLINTSVMTAALTSLILGALMCALVIGCHYLRLDPDNIATPIAATLGDLVTLWILAGISHAALVAIDTPTTPIILFTIILSLPIWILFTRRNEHVSGVLRNGWTPIIVSMVISSAAGLVMERYIQRFQGLAVLIPVLNGVVGNLGTIYCARFSSRLHLGETEDHRRTQVSLFWISLPLQGGFLFAVHLFGLGHTTVTPIFSLVYMTVSVLLLMGILKLARTMCEWLWDHDMDPDDHALPYLTSICDVVGTIAIVAAFFFLFYIGDRDMDVGD